MEYCVVYSLSIVLLFQNPILISGLPSAYNAQVRASTPFLVAPKCNNAIDLVIAIDTSGSMEASLSQVLDDAETLASEFSVSDDKVRIGVIDFSAVSNMHKALDSNNTDKRVYQTLQEVRFRPQLGETWPELALDRASDIFVKASPQRKEAKRIMVMFTDGDLTSDEKEGITSLMKNLRFQNVSIFVVEVQNNSIRRAGTALMATSQNHIYKSIFASNYSQPLLKDAICWGIPTPIIVQATTPLTMTQAKPGNQPTTPPPQRPTLIKPAIIINPPPVSGSEKQPNNSLIHTTNYTNGGQEYYAVKVDFNEKTGQHEGIIIDPSGVVPDIYKPKNMSGDPMYKALSSPKATAATSNTNYTQTSAAKTASSLKQTTTKCLEMEKYAVANPSQFYPLCEPDGRFSASQIDYPTGFKWCVDQDTGLEIYGTKQSLMEPIKCDETLKNVTHKPKTKCEFELLEGRKTQLMFADYEPLYCSPVDGLYEEIQTSYFTGSWCVNRYTGKEINGTHVKNGNPSCPAQSKCESDREKAIGHNYRQSETLGPIFVPDCEPSGNFNKIQWQLNDGSAWCVDVYTGLEIPNTRIKGQHQQLPKCPGMSPRCMRPLELHVSNGTEVLCDLYYYDVSSGICKTGKGSPCGTNNDNEFKTLEECKAECETKKPTAITLYGEAQQTAKPSQRVNVQATSQPEVEPEPPRTTAIQTQQVSVQATLQPGVEPQIQRTTAKPSQQVSAQATPEPEAEPESPENGLYSTHGLAPASEPEPEVLPAPPEVDVYNPKFNCEVERDFAMQRKSSLHYKDVFIPECDANGNYKMLQHLYSGERWCVDPTSGKMIDGTMRKTGESDPVCDKGSQTSSATEISKVVSNNDTIGNESHALGYIPPQIVSSNVTVLPAIQLPPPPPPLPSPEPVASITPPTPQPSPSTTPQTPPPQPSTLPAPQPPPSTSTAPQPSSGTPKAPLPQPSTTPQTAQLTSTPVAMPKFEKLVSPSPSLSSSEVSAATSLNVNVSTGNTSLSNEQSSEQLNCNYTIGKNLIKLGCHRDIHQIPQPLPVTIFSRSTEGRKAYEDKKKWGSFVREVVCECAEKTRAKGWYTFGIQNYGDCYSGPDEGRYDEDGSADNNMCLNEAREACDKADNAACVGIPAADKFVQNKMNLANAVFMIKTEQHQQTIRIEYDRKKRFLLKAKKHNKRSLNHSRYNHKKLTKKRRNLR